jgi:riboflavin transporter FmnP
MNTALKMQRNEKIKEGSLFSIRSLTVIAMLSAVAFVLMYFEIPLWFAPNFYKLDFSEVPVLIGAFALGPAAGVMIELIKVILNLVMQGTDTMVIGEFANFLIGCSMVVPAAILYQRRKSRKSAMIGLSLGTIGMIVIGSILNAFVLLPVYAYFYGGIPLGSLIEYGTAVNPAITNLPTFILFAVAPFNLLKGVVVSAITIVLYKRLSIIIKSITK